MLHGCDIYADSPQICRQIYHTWSIWDMMLSLDFYNISCWVISLRHPAIIELVGLFVTGLLQLGTSTMAFSRFPRLNIQETMVSPMTWIRFPVHFFPWTNDKSNLQPMSLTWWLGALKMGDFGIAKVLSCTLACARGLRASASGSARYLKEPG